MPARMIAKRKKRNVPASARHEVWREPGSTTEKKA